jgi:hypothetical protein
VPGRSRRDEPVAEPEPAVGVERPPTRRKPHARFGPFYSFGGTLLNPSYRPIEALRPQRTYAAPPPVGLAPFEAVVRTLVLPLHRARVPFLPRSLPRSPAPATPVDVPLYVEYREPGGASHVEPLRGWRCPLCALFGHFAGAEPLRAHLAADHDEVAVRWEPSQDVQVRNRLRGAGTDAG